MYAVYIDLYNRYDQIELSERFSGPTKAAAQAQARRWLAQSYGADEAQRMRAYRKIIRRDMYEVWEYAAEVRHGA